MEKNDFLENILSRKQGKYIYDLIGLVFRSERLFSS